MADSHNSHASSPCATALEQWSGRAAPRRNGPRLLLIAGLAAVLTIATGCAEGNWSMRGDVRDDIVSIQQYPAAVPWLRDEEGRVNGITVRVYFVSAQTERGVFVPGPMAVELDVLTPRPDGGYEREAVHEWRLSEQQAAGYRMRSRSSMGYSYGLVLRWPSALNLTGREIQLIYKYTRTNGTAITRRSSHFQVPAPPGQAHTERPSSAWRRAEPRSPDAPTTRPAPSRE